MLATRLTVCVWLVWWSFGEASSVSQAVGVCERVDPCIRILADPGHVQILECEIMCYSSMLWGCSWQRLAWEFWCSGWRLCPSRVVLLPARPARLLGNQAYIWCTYPSCRLFGIYLHLYRYMASIQLWQTWIIFKKVGIPPPPQSWGKLWKISVNLNPSQETWIHLRKSDEPRKLKLSKKSRLGQEKWDVTPVKGKSILVPTISIHDSIFWKFHQHFSLKYFIEVSCIFSWRLPRNFSWHFWTM